jgi:hypothetical protein
MLLKVLRVWVVGCILAAIGILFWQVTEEKAEERDAIQEQIAECLEAGGTPYYTETLLGDLDEWLGCKE